MKCVELLKGKEKKIQNEWIFERMKLSEKENGRNIKNEST